MVPGEVDVTTAPRGHVALVGLSGSGKSSTARRLARRLGLALVDTDRSVERGAGLTIAELFAEGGESSFRLLESQALADALDGPDAVVATGGGVVLDESNRRLLRDRATVVWMQADPDALATRLDATAEVRPLLGDDPADALRHLAARREPLYREVADVVVDTTGRDPTEVLDVVLDALSETARRDGEEASR